MSNVVTLPLPSNRITGDQILRLPRVKELTGMSRSFIYSDKDFPKAIPLGGRAVGWLRSEVLSWIDSRKAMRQQEAA